MEAIPSVCRNVSYFDFYFDFLVANKPCVLPSCSTETWKARKEWVTDKGDQEVPVIPMVSDLSYDARSQTMKLRDFLSVLKRDDCKFYLKDWHFDSANPNYQAYEVPKYFSSDWVAECTKLEQNPFNGDFQFVYLGPKDSWTPLHADVFNSFSWSANICGRKLWYFIPPGNETLFHADTSVAGDPTFISDIRSRRDLFNTAGVMEIIQEPGEIVFVPSGWYHQVHNLETTLSINRNWANAANVWKIWDYVKERYERAQDAIADCREIMTEEQFKSQCQLLTQADARLNRSLMFDWLRSILKNRTINTTEQSNGAHFPVCTKHAQLLDCFLDLDCRKRLKFEASSRCDSEKCQTDLHYLCDRCLMLQTWIDRKICTEIINVLEQL